LEFPPLSVDVNRLGDRPWVLVAIFFMVIAGSACSRNDASRGAMAPLMAKMQVAQEDHGSTLSRQHAVVIDVPETELETRFRSVSDHCTTDSAHHCTILQSDLSTGQSPSGLVKLRIDPNAVEELITFAAALGKLEHRSTTVTDLADSIQDTQSRIEMLTNYRKQLLALQAKAATNVDAAIKIASELSRVQGELERATGEAAYQTKRVTTDIVTISFAVAEQRAFWRPVREALRDFLGNLSSGVSQAITAVAYIVPWLFVVVPGLYLLRFLWWRRGR
jgi:Domain of unknown function (DUF4349)